MDKLDVPKKINRHVLKAISQLNENGEEEPNHSNICDMVKYTMRNTVPVANLPNVVRHSLRNLHELGVIKRQGSNYYTKLDQLEQLPSTTKRVSKRIFKRSAHQNEKSNVNLNKKRRHQSEDSISGNEREKSRKRLRTNKPLSRKGRQVHLPKVRVFGYQLSDIKYDEDDRDPSEDEYENQEHNKSDCSSTDMQREPHRGTSEKDIVGCGTFLTELYTNNEYRVQSNSESSNELIDLPTQNLPLNENECKNNGAPFIEIQPALDEGIECNNVFKTDQDSNDKRNEYIAPKTEPNNENIVTNNFIEVETENSSGTEIKKQSTDEHLNLE